MLLWPSMETVPESIHIIGFIVNNAEYSIDILESIAASHNALFVLFLLSGHGKVVILFFECKTVRARSFLCFRWCRIDSRNDDNQ